MRMAYEQALKSYNEGGIPVGAVMAEDGQVIAFGHNKRIQNGDPTAHGEIDCIRKAGRRSRYNAVTLYTTLSPCMMCSGAILQLGIPRVVIGENRNFPGNIDFLRQREVEVLLLNDPDCEGLMSRFIKENPAISDDDIPGRTNL
jgi:cytosine deaminase